MRLVQIGTLILADNDARDSYPQHIRSSLADMKNGAYDFDGSEAVFEAGNTSRTIFLNGSKIDEQYDHLTQILAAGRVVAKFVLRDGRYRDTYVKVTGFTPQVNATDWACKQPLQLNWSRTYPFYWDDDHLLFMDTGLTFDSGLTFDNHYDAFVMAASPITFSVNYTGTVPGRMVAFCIVPRGGSSIADILVENLTNGMSFLYSGTVAATTRLDIDNPTKTVMNNSTDDYDNLSFADDKQCEIMHLALGGNNFRITATIVGTIDIYVQWIAEFA